MTYQHLQIMHQAMDKARLRSINNEKIKIVMVEIKISLDGSCSLFSKNTLIKHLEWKTPDKKKESFKLFYLENELKWDMAS